MRLLRDFSPHLVLAGIVALQLSCGDSSGPGGNASATITANSSTALHGAPGAPVDELPSVIVQDASGNPVSGVAVNFVVGSGGGSVTGNHPVSDASGVATVGSWTLGPTSGTNILVASLNGHSVTFTADGVDPCAALSTHTIGSTTNGQLAAGDCQLTDGSLADFYQVTIATAGTYIFDQTSTTFDTFLAMLTSTGAVVGLNDDIDATHTDSRLKTILPAGTFIVVANSFHPNVTGAYALTSAGSGGDVTNCEDAFLVVGVTSNQNLQATDCNVNGIFGDEYVVFLAAGRTVTINMGSAQFDSYLEIHDATSILASNDDADATTKNARLTYTVASDGFYVIAARTTVAGASGPYSLSVQ